MANNVVIGNSVMVIGDLHFSDVFTGKHKAYLENCFWVLGKITKKLEEKKPSALVLGGDIIGWTETNIRDRQVFAMFCKVLRDWNKICPVYAVRGNHDMKGYPDFQFLADFGLIITSAECGGYFDYYGYEGQEHPEVRFHLVDYKEEGRSLDLAEGESSNIVLAHNNFTINGVTTWYNNHDGIELGMMQNFCGVDMVIAGHIHNPSPEIYAVQMPDGESCMLFYTGCPTRPIKDNNMYDSCWYVFIEYDKESASTDINTEEFKLKPASEIFYATEDFVDEKSEDDIAEELRQEALKDVLGDLLKYRMNQTDPISQIDNIPNATPEAKGIAKDYLQMAFNKGA